MYHDENILYEFNYHKECTQLQFVLETAASNVTKSNIGEKMKGVLNFVKEKIVNAGKTIWNFIKKLFGIADKTNKSATDSSPLSSEQLNNIRSGEKIEITPEKDHDNEEQINKLNAEIDKVIMSLMQLPIVYDVGDGNIKFQFAKGGNGEIKKNLSLGFAVIRELKYFEEIAEKFDIDTLESKKGGMLGHISNTIQQVYIHLRKAEQDILSNGTTLSNNMNIDTTPIRNLVSNLQKASLHFENNPNKDNGKAAYTFDQQINQMNELMVKIQKALMEVINVVRKISEVELKLSALNNLQ